MRLKNILIIAYVILQNFFSAECSYAQWISAGQKETAPMSALTGTHYIGSLGDYASLKQAIDSVNILGVGAGGVTFSFFSSHVEKSANMNITTTTASSSNPLIFQYFGYTNIPKIYAAAGTSTTNDAIIKICGTDYVTFDNIQFIDTNTISATNQMEWGIAVLKASGSDGSQNITIKNCSVKLKVNYTAGVGIYSNNHTSASLSQLTVTSFSGTNSYLKIYNNTVDGPYIGIQITGYNHTSSPYNLYDHGNEIGVGGQNFIVNFGGSTTANYGIYASYQDSIKISNNYVGSNYGSTNAVYGIYTAAGTGSAVDIHSNEVSLSSGSTASNMYGIKNDMGSSGTGNTVNIDMNTIHNCINNYSLATLDQYAINNTATPSVLNIFGNNISDNRSRGTGAFYGISAGSSPLKRIYNNQIYNNIREGSNGVMYLIHVSGGTSTVCYGNSIYNDSIPSASGGSNSVVCGYVNSSGGGALDSIFNNNIYNLGIKGNTTATSTAVYGIFSTGPTSKSIFGNNIYNLNTKIGSVQGIYASASGYFNLYGNRIYGLRDSTTTYGEVYGINITSGTSTNIYNNFISELYTPVLNKQDAIYGMFIGGSSGNIVNLYYNTIYLDASSTGSLFGTNGIYAFTAPLVELSNNLVINKSVPGNGNYLAKTVAFKRSGSLLTTYSGASNNNCFYSGTPDTSRVIFFDGTNFDRTLSEWKARITPRESNSVSVNPVFKNSASKPYNLHLDSTVISLLESGGRIISSPLSITQDFDGHSRYPNSGYPNNPLSPATAPDIGADEFAGKNSLAGTFYVQPTGGNYANLTDAVNDLNNNLIGAGGVTFLIQSGQTFNEPAPLNITATGTASNQIIFKRNGNGARPVINVMGTGSYGEACIRLNGSDYITFDSLEIRDAGTSYTTYNANVFYFRSISSDSNGCQNNTVSNCVISMSNDNMNSCGVYLSTNASLYAGTNSRNRFLNDSVIKCVSGYKFQGSNSFPDIGNRIGTTGNGRSKLFNIGGNSANPFYAVYLWGQDSVSVFNTDIDSVWSSMYASKTGIQISMNNNVTVSGNTIHGFRRASMQSDETGIAVYYTNSAVISNNKIYDLNSSGSATGIQVLNSFVSFIYNNFIYDLKSSSTYSMVKGIDLSGGTADSVFYNTVYLDYASVSSNNKSAALYVGSGVTLIDLRNNIFVNKTDVSAGSLAAAFYSDAGSHSNISPNSNNNLFYAGTPSLNNLIYYNSGLSYSDSSISQYKTHLAPKDSNAFTENPHFIRTSPPYDLHIDTAYTTLIESGGKIINSVANDFDGNPRYPNPGYPDNPSFTAIAPDVGADEFAGIRPATVLYSADIYTYSGWNLISVPYKTSNMHISGLFPGNSNNAFVFDSGSYKQTDSLIRGRGCWLNFDSSKSYTVTGRKTDTNIVPVSQGWNIIGTFDYTVYTSEITSDPANILESNFFGFSNGYFPAWTLSSGGGYWVYVSQAGNLTLPNLGVKKPVAGTEPVNSFGDFANIEFKDESGNKSNLYFCVGNVNTEFYKLPPVPPSSSFDARFENNSYVRNLNLKQHSVNIQSTLGNYSLKIINAGNIKFKIRDAVNGKMVNKTLINGQEILIDGRIDKLIIENDFAVPLTYELMQNYPNPFNSMTKINYQIPSQGFVTIKIYDVTGRLIKTLLNDIRDAGEYSVLFDAGGLSSGVYFYSFVSGNFTSVKKMMYIK